MRRHRSWKRWASPHSCTVNPARGVSLEVGGHDTGRPAIEGKRRDQHTPVAHRHEVRLAPRVLLLQQGDRVRAVGGGLPLCPDSTGACACAAPYRVLAVPRRRGAELRRDALPRSLPSRCPFAGARVGTATWRGARRPCAETARPQDPTADWLSGEPPGCRLDPRVPHVSVLRFCHDASPRPGRFSPPSPSWRPASRVGCRPNATSTRPLGP